MINRIRNSLFNAAFYVAVFGAAYVGTFTLGRAFETAYFPVFSYFEITSATELKSGAIRVQVRFSKLRQCEPGGFAWYAGKRDGNFRAVVVDIPKQYGAQTNIRPVGRGQVSEPFDLILTPEEFEAGIFADVYSRCHPLWLTRSEVYPDPDKLQELKVRRARD